jgi:arylsulfatase A-like enzyme
MMTRRELLAAPLAMAQQAQRPNVLLILADDFGQECLNCYGGESYKTPNLDRFAQQGTRFTHAYAQPLCTPTRVQLMTGQLNFRNWVGFGLINPQERTFGHMMREAGYRTAIAGKWQFYSYEADGSPRHRIGMLPEQSGFHEWLRWHDRDTETKGSRYANPVINENGSMRADTRGKYGEDEFADFLIRLMKQESSKPFFAYYSMVLTHGPFNPTPRSADWASGNRLKDDPKYFGDMVEYLDATVGRVLAATPANTLVLFFADNGTPREITSRFQGRSMRGGKGFTTEAGMHVPLLARRPGQKAGSVCRDLVDSTDFIPTICEFTGARLFEGQPLDGRSFLPQLQGKKGNPREALFAHYDPHPGCKVDFKPTRLVWDHQHKLYPDGRLYHWTQDPDEQAPLKQAAPRHLRTLMDQMNQRHPPKYNQFSTDGRTAY